jgi:hypothetical protein
VKKISRPALPPGGGSEWPPEKLSTPGTRRSESRPEGSELPPLARTSKRSPRYTRSSFSSPSTKSGFVSPRANWKAEGLHRRVQEELERYVLQVVEQFAVADRRGIQRLEGNFSSMRIQKNPDSVLVTDSNAIPFAYEQVILAMPAYVWEALLIRVGHRDRKEFESRVDKQEFRPDKEGHCRGTEEGRCDPRRRPEVRQ